MRYLAELLIVLPLTILMAWWHHWLINKGRKIQHGWWALVACGFIGAAIWWRWHTLQFIWYWFALACLCGRLVVFNISLNLFRHYSPFYISPTTTSILDKIEMRAFGKRVWLAEAVMFLLFMTLQFFI